MSVATFSDWMTADDYTTKVTWSRRIVHEPGLLRKLTLNPRHALSFDVIMASSMAINWQSKQDCF